MNIVIAIILVFITSNFSIAYEYPRPTFTGSVGIIDVDNASGFNTVVGLQYSNSNLLSFVNFLDLKITEEENERYYMDKFSNGVERCRDKTNGQFAKEEKCDPVYDYDYALSFDVNYLIDPDKKSFFLGGGLRFGREIVPYASLGYAFKEITSSHCFLKTEIGDNLYKATIGYSF